MIKNLIMGAIAVAVLLWVLAACTEGRGKKSNGDSKPVVAVSIPPEIFFINNIAGDRVETVCLMGNSADPETFEPSMNQLMTLENADLFLPVGLLPFENRLIQQVGSNKSKVKIRPVSNNIGLLEDTHGHDSHDHGNAEMAADPHVWSSVKNAMVIARNVLDALIEVDSKNEDVYRANYGRLVNRLDSIDSCFDGVFSAMQPKPAFIVWHPSLSYFAKDYGLTQLSLSDAGKEMSVKGLSDKINGLPRTDEKPVYFYQMEFDTDRAAAFARETGARIVEINPMNMEWEDEMQKLYDAFTLD